MMVMCACNFSNDVMARGVAECRNQHRFCIQCALNTAPKSFGIRDLVLRSSVDQALTWFGFKCSVCGVKGPLRRSLATDTAVAALPVRCGSSEDGATCRWTGRRDEFDAHRHVFSDEELELQATEQQSPSRGTKRPNEDRDSNEVDDPHDVKQCRRYQQTSEQSENEAGFLGGQITSPGTVPGSAAPGIDAAGDPEVLDVTSVEIHQEDDELYITVEESQSGSPFPRAAVMMQEIPLISDSVRTKTETPTKMRTDVVFFTSRPSTTTTRDSQKMTSGSKVSRSTPQVPFLVQQFQTPTQPASRKI